MQPFTKCTYHVVFSRMFASASQQTYPAENPIGKLQEIAQKKYIAPPTYEFQDNGCLQHEREYSCTVSLLQHSNTGKSNLNLIYYRLLFQFAINRCSLPGNYTRWAERYGRFCVKQHRAVHQR